MQQSRLFVILILLCCSLLVTCDDNSTGPERFANTYNLLLNKDRAELLTDICPTPDGCIVGGIGNDKAHFMRIDYDGNVIWEYDVTADNSYSADFDISVDYNLDYSLSAITAEHNGLRRFIISILSQGGTVISESRFESSQWSLYHKILKTIDGNLILIGECTNEMIPIVKTDYKGNLIWETGIKDENYKDFYMGLDTKSMGLVLYGYKWSEERQMLEVNLIKFDKYGNRKWEKSLGYIDEFLLRHPGVYRQCIAECSDGGVVLLGSENSGSDGNLALMKLNKYGNVEWRQVYTGTHLLTGCAVLEDNGDIIATGYVDNPEITGEERLRPTFLMKVDRNGIPKWVRQYPGIFRLRLPYTFMDYMEMPYALCRATDGGYFISGGLVNEGGGFIVKTDINGNISDSVIEIEHLQ